MVLCVTPTSAMAQNSCLTEALQLYTKLKTAAMMGANSASVLSPATIVGLRRMEETYCYRVAYCIVGDPNSNPSLQVPYAVEFSKCLRDEALEKYDAVVK